MLRPESKKLPLIIKKLADTRNRALIACVSECQSSNLDAIHSADIHDLSARIIEMAEKEVCIQFYKFFNESDGGKKIIEGLTKLYMKAERDKPRIPITVNIILNARGEAAQIFYKKNNETGLELLMDQWNKSKYFKMYMVYHPADAFGTFHSKMIIIDGRLGMLRGGDPAPPNDDKNAQFETAVLIKGSSVWSIRMDFLDSWNRFRKTNPLMLEDSVEKKLSHYQGAVEIPCLFISKKENGTPYGSIKYHDSESPYKIALLEAIRVATRSIKIMTPNLNDREIANALASACNRGIDVQIIMGKYHNDSAEKHWGGTNLETMALLVEQVNVSHRKYIQIHWATNDKGDVVKHGEAYTMHGKYACIDTSLVFVGSTPLDKQGLYHSRETDLIFEDSPKAIEFTEVFFRDKYLFGKDYFDDCVAELVKEIQNQIIRIKKNGLDNRNQERALNYREKANLLKNELTDVLLRIDHPDVKKHDKPIILLKTMLPILARSTRDIRYMTQTESFKSVSGLAKKYGIYESNPVEEGKSQDPGLLSAASEVAVALPPLVSDSTVLISSSLGGGSSVTTSTLDDPLADEVDALLAERQEQKSSKDSKEVDFEKESRSKSSAHVKSQKGGVS